MNIQEFAIEELIPYENNPRRNGASVEPVAASIKEFGFKVPIIIDASKVIVAGHTRLLAAKELGLKKVPCIVADDLSEDQVRAFRLADNKVGESSSWDWGKLEQELAGLSVMDFDMSPFGFLEDTDIDAMFQDGPGSAKSGSKTEADSDEAEDLEAEEENPFSDAEDGGYIRIKIRDTDEQDKIERFCIDNGMEYEVVHRGS